MNKIKLHLIGLFLPLCFSSSIFSAEKVARCHIKLHFIFKTGESSEKQFDLNLKSKKDCQKASKNYEANLNPEAIKSVKVRYEWK